MRAVDRGEHSYLTSEADPAPQGSAWTRFWFAPGDPLPLHIVRVLVGLAVLFWLAPLATQAPALFALDGWLDDEVHAAARQFDNGIPLDDRPDARVLPAAWSPIFAKTGSGYLFSATSPAPMYALVGASLAAALLFTLGIATRLTGVLTWLAVVTFSANPLFAGTGTETILLALTFSLAIGYLLAGWGVGKPIERFLGSKHDQIWRLPGQFRAPAPASVGANLGLRLVQAHLAIAIFALGLAKLQVAVWWSGIALWFPLQGPSVLTRDAFIALRDHAAGYLTILSLAAYLMLAWQLSFPFVAWRGFGRFFAALGAAIGFVGCAYIYQLSILGFAIFAGALTFLHPGDWRRIVGGSKRHTETTRHRHIERAELAGERV